MQPDHLTEERLKRLESQMGFVQFVCGSLTPWVIALALLHFSSAGNVFRDRHPQTSNVDRDANPPLPVSEPVLLRQSGGATWQRVAGFGRESACLQIPDAF